MDTDNLAAEIFRNCSDYAAQYLRCFSRAIAHGDLEHQGWLREAAEAFIKGEPLPPPRGKGTQDKQVDAEPHREPDPTKVICPNCTHQFTAISVADQERLRVQSDAEPVAINDAKEQALSEVYVKGFEDGRAQSDAEPGKGIGIGMMAKWPPYPWIGTGITNEAQSDAEPGDRFRTSYNRFCANAQSDAKERREEELREDERLGAALRRAQDAEDRLAALAQSGAGPVAWQWRAKYTNGWSKWTEASEEVAKCNGSQGQCEWRALYAAPPCPDASAGLIEAAEIVYAKWDKLSDSDPKACGDMWELYNELRARAADKMLNASGPKDIATGWPLPDRAADRNGKP